MSREATTLPRVVRLAAVLSLFAAGSAACTAPSGQTTADGTAGQDERTGATSVSSSEPGPLEVYAPGADRAEVVGTLQLLFDALERRDPELLSRSIDPSVVMHFAEVRDGVTTRGTSTVDALAARIAGADDPLIERMWDPVVVVNGPLATIWAPYDFYVGETFSHCGIDTADLLRTDDGWRIVGLSWTRLQPPACELHPEGPPA